MNSKNLQEAVSTELRYNRLELEYAVIGGLISNSARLGVLLPTLSAGDFRDPVCRDMFKALGKMFDAGATIERVTLCAEMGPEYDEAVAEAVKRTGWDVDYYIELLREAQKREDLTAIGSALLNIRSLDEVSGIADELSRLTQRRGYKVVKMADAVQRFFDRHTDGKEPEYLKWGIDRLDSVLMAEGGDFIAIGGYPSSGKTLLASQFAVSLAKSGKRVGFFSLETKESKITDRMLCQVSGVELSKIKRNKLNNDEWRRLSDAAQTLSRLPIDVIEAAGMSVAEIKGVSLANAYEVIFIDYLQLIRSDRRDRYEAVTQISIDLHNFAPSSGITVVALAQLRRPERAGKKTPPPPSMSDFRESGQIEQDLDIAMILYPLDVNDNDSNRMLKIAKNKEGRRGQLELVFDGARQTMTPAPPDKGEGYRKMERELGEIKRQQKAEARARKASVDGQASFDELAGDSEPLPF